jgi:broad specificity phosphatase PhoE
MTERGSGTTRIILVRHGQTEWNRVERFRGRMDIELNEMGWHQAQAVARRLHREHIDAVYSSPMKRAVQTAEPLAEVHGLEVQALERLNDIDYGAWAGLTPDEVASTDVDLYQAWLDTPHLVRFPDGESLDDVRSRAWEVLEQVYLRHEGRTTVLVSHLVVNRVLISAFLGLSNASFWQIGQSNAAINILEVRDAERRLLVLNDTCHLESLSSAGERDACAVSQRQEM